MVAQVTLLLGKICTLIFKNKNIERKGIVLYRQAENIDE